MKKINLLTGIIIVLSLVSCSVDKNDNGNGEEPVFKAKLLKKITNSDGYWHKYFYNDKKQIELMTQTSNQIDLDSTYFFYENGNLTKTLQRVYTPTDIINTELVYTVFNATTASGTYKVFKDDGTVFQNQTFEYKFLNNLVKNITFFNLDGTKSSEKIYTHDVAGNLTQWDEIWYGSNNTVNSQKVHTFSEWDVDGLKTQSLLYWNYRIDNIPNRFISSNNCLNRTENNQTYRYSFDYDADGNVTKNYSINENKFITLEYYEE